MKMEAQIRLINIDQIIPNRFQPRLHFNDEGLEDLSTSIKEHGIIQPLVLRRVGDKYEIIAGERRYKASQLAGLTAVPAIITDLDDNESAEVAILENTQRRNLSAIEEGKSYKKLLDRKYVTQDQLARRLGTSQANIANKIRLLSLAEEVQDALIEERISERHARSLLKVTDKVKQVELLNRTIEERWPVRRLDEEIEDVVENYNKLYNTSTGAINVGKNDIDITSIQSNAQDLVIDDTLPTFRNYSNPVTSSANKKNSLFFNNLENEEVNMDPDATPRISLSVDDDYDILDLDDDNEEDQQPITEGKVTERVIVKEEVIETDEDAIEAIKKIINKAKANEVGLEAEEFGFDTCYQFVIRIEKEEKEDK